MNHWDKYWENRKDLPYYKVVKRWLEELSVSTRDSILDIGCGGTPICTYGNFSHRTALNLEPFTPISGVENIVSDWFEYECPKKTVITCLQVLEHFNFEKNQKFVDKIFKSCYTAIISVPYRWPEGMCKDHIQDPIDVTKFIRMVGRDPIKLELAQNRLVGIFTNE